MQIFAIETIKIIKLHAQTKLKANVHNKHYNK